MSLQSLPETDMLTETDMLYVITTKGFIKSTTALTVMSSV